MGGAGRKDLSSHDRVFCILVSRPDTKAALRELGGVLPAKDFSRVNRLLPQMDSVTIEEWMSLYDGIDDECLRPGLFQRRLLRDASVLGAPGRAVRRVRDRLDLSETEEAALTVLEAHAAIEHGDAQPAIQALLVLRNTYRNSEAALEVRLFGAACSALGRAYRPLGDYWRSELHLREGIRAYRQWGMCPLAAAQNLGDLLWISGQFGRALRAHQDQDLRGAAADAGRHDYLARSHLYAAKCALDLRQRELFADRQRPDLLEVATDELASARRLFDQHADGFQWGLEGYFTVYSGQLAIHTDSDTELAQHRYLDAIDHFRSREPAFHHGIMMAKCELLGLEMWVGHSKQKCAEMVENLIAESERRGVIESKTRLIALEAALFVSDQPPIKQAFDNLIERVHLMNNPRLMFMALGDLFGYAARHGLEEQQTHLRSRIERLKPLLKRSCYNGLFHEYVEKRYLWAAEERWLEDEARFDLDDDVNANSDDHRGHENE